MKTTQAASDTTSGSKQRKPRKKFTEEEDKKLESLVKVFGENSWIIIAKAMVGRTTRQCRERYKTYLAPSLHNGPWTSEEDSQLISLYNSLGPKWAEISRHFIGRSDNNVKNRWYTYLKNRDNSSSMVSQNDEIDPKETDKPIEDTEDITSVFGRFEDSLEYGLDFEQFSEPCY